MFLLVLFVLSALTISFVLTPLCRDFFGFLGVMDTPDFKRKTHVRPIPRVGGVALAVAYFCSLTALFWGCWRGLFDLQDPNISIMMRLLPSAVVMFAIGLWDDLWGLSPGRKLAGQTAAAAYACLIAIHVALPANTPVLLVAAANIAGIFWLVLCANAFNLIDGLDGLAAGVATIGCLSLFAVALIHHDVGLALVITPLIGALLGFLYYNFNPASVFLGDCGSLTVGFLLGCYGLMWSNTAAAGYGKSVPLIALALPVFEVALSTVRRFLRNRPIFGSDKNHIHHRIVGIGFSHRDAALVLYAAAALAGLTAILQSIASPVFALACLALAGCIAAVGFRWLRYTEFGVLSTFLFAGDLRRSLRVMIELREFAAALDSAESIEDCWTALRDTCRDANFGYVALRLRDVYFEADLHPLQANTQRFRFSLSQGEDVVFETDAGLGGPAMLVAPLVERLQQRLHFIESLPRPKPPEVLQAKAATAR